MPEPCFIPCSATAARPMRKALLRHGVLISMLVLSVDAPLWAHGTPVVTAWGDRYELDIPYIELRTGQERAAYAATLDTRDLLHVTVLTVTPLALEATTASTPSIAWDDGGLYAHFPHVEVNIGATRRTFQFDLRGSDLASLTVDLASTTELPASPGRWTPALGDTWQWQLQGPLNTGYAADVYDLDLVDTPTATIAALKAQGRRVVCYFSAGSSENWRPDFSRFTATDMGNPLSGWLGERWLDTRSENVRAVMKDRLDLAVTKGCDAVEPDNIDGFTNRPGFALTAQTQLDYNRFLAREAHARGLAVGLKNDVAQLEDLVSHFDFAVNEQCHQFNECEGYAVFTARGKAVFNAEYADAYRSNAGGARDALCLSARASSMRTLVLAMALDDSTRFSCD